MSEDAEDKTEEPSSKKLDKAREEGNIAQSTEVRILASLVAAMIIVGMLAPHTARSLEKLLRPFIERPHEIQTDLSSLLNLSMDMGIGTAQALAMPFAVVIIIALALSMVQNRGILWVPKKIAPSFQKINPWAGLKRMFSPTQIVELVKALTKLTVLGALMTWLLMANLGDIRHTAQLELLDLLGYIQDQVYWLGFVTVLMILAIAGADYAFQHWRWMEKMRMTKQELKDEHKQQEGDPHIKARIRSLRIQRARKRMMASVPKASVVITNPTHYAVALRYEPETMNAPMLVAKGADLVAKRIRDLATDHDIPIVENPPLARALYATVDLDREVPPEHYKAVAEVISYVMKLRGERAH